MLEKIKVPKVNEGLTSGVSAFMLLKARNEKSLKSLSLLGNVHSVADYEAAAECLKKANDLLDIKIDVGPLLEEAKQAKALLCIRKIAERQRALFKMRIAYHYVGLSKWMENFQS